jgi:carbamoyltransferase
MPFAPSVIRGSAAQIIMTPKKQCDDQYMIISFDTTDFGRKNIIAAIQPADKTCRPQVVDQDWNKDYHKLIKDFKGEAGVGAVLNTSFNLHGEPIVCSPEDAMSTMERSGLRFLVMGNYIIRKI